MLCNLALGQQGVHRDNPALQYQVVQQVESHRDLIRLVIHRLLGQRQAHAVGQR